MGDFLIRACKQETRSKLSSAGSGMKSGAKIQRDTFVVANHRSWNACGHLMDSAHSRDDHHNVNESCCFTSGGITILDRSQGDVDSKNVEGGWSGLPGPLQQCQKNHLVEASLMEMACPVAIAWAMARPLLGIEMWATTHRMSSGRLASRLETSVRAGVRRQQWRGLSDNG